MPTLTVSELARRVGATVSGDPDRSLTGVASLKAAGPQDLTFFARETMRGAAEQTRAGAVLAAPDFDVSGVACSVLTVDDPEFSFARIVRFFHPEPRPAGGIHPSVRIGRGARIGADVSLAEGVIVEGGVRIGRGTWVGSGTLIGRGAHLGEACRIGPAVSILHDVEIGDRVRVHAGARIGSDGFGYAAGPDGAHKIPQIGGCVIGHDVEIGANCAIDRGALDDTRIGDRTKLDNLVHVAHNVRIGSDCLIAAQVGIAGSTVVGAGVHFGGQAGVAGHLTIGAGARISAQAGVMRDVPAGATHGGTPAQPQRSWMKAAAYARRLPELLRRVSRVERHLGLDGAEREGPTEDGTV
ncbi:UDP-3-O-(3-hydroxymyristoyl)glucosamine N-acyltransferase [Candidatus Palauibacter sp.]|uniref:UDP-3-O-(3-hydroxymyristoyl)glucosamine N-acyltransferase n=1 Tax=Candidatus Palauibacter sp. TaxID=3101350 RepID=UPI003B017068